MEGIKTRKCGRWVAGQTIALNKKFLGRETENFMCIDCLAEYLGTVKEVLFDRIRDFIEIEKCELFNDEKFDKSKTALQKAQKLSLWEKLKITCERITEWYYFYRGKVYVSFSGGKDSTVLLHIVRKLFPDVEAVFVNTGLEFPEIQKFVKTFDNVTILRPKMRFDEVIKTYGYPLISKEASERVANAKKCLASGGKHYKQHYYDVARELPTRGKQLLETGGFESRKYDFSKWKPLLEVDFNVSNKCCNVMKKKPVKEYAKASDKKPITAQMASESRLREQAWYKNGCNGFDMKSPISNPMSFWLEQDVLLYIKTEDIPIASVYGDVVCVDKYGFEYSADLFGEYEHLKTTGCDRTGCIFCAFGCHLKKSPSRFERLKETHPRQYEYCICGGEYNEKGVWQPNKKGLGMGHVFDELNKIYGEGFIKY